LISAENWYSVISSLLRPCLWALTLKFLSVICHPSIFSPIL
jgi:hypothetical protein